MDRQTASSIKREAVERYLRDAELYTREGSSFEDLAKARELLQIALELMKDGWPHSFLFPSRPEFGGSAAFSGDGRMTREDRKEVWDRWKEAQEAVRIYRNARYRDRQEAQDAIFADFELRAKEAVNTATYGDPKDAKAEVRAMQQDLRASSMRREQFARIRELLDLAWQTACERLRQRQEDWLQKRLEWKQRMTENLERWREQLQKKEELRDRVSDQIDDLEEKISEAWTEEWADQARGWVDDKSTFLGQLEDQIETLETRIADVERRLDDDD